MFVASKPAAVPEQEKLLWGTAAGFFLKKTKGSSAS
jgi:hypothetical protein